MPLPEIPACYCISSDRKDWDALLKNWRPLIPPKSAIWLLTKFGEVFFEQEDGKIGVLQVTGFHYEVVAKNKTDFREWLVDPDKLSEWFLAPLADQLEASGKMLPPEKCYSFITPLGLGGKLEIENVMVIPIAKHFGCFGEIFQQIKDMPDGAQVQIRVVP